MRHICMSHLKIPYQHEQISSWFISENRVNQFYARQAVFLINCCHGDAFLIFEHLTIYTEQQKLSIVLNLRIFFYSEDCKCGWYINIFFCSVKIQFIEFVKKTLVFTIQSRALSPFIVWCKGWLKCRLLSCVVAKYSATVNPCTQLLHSMIWGATSPVFFALIIHDYFKDIRPRNIHQFTLHRGTMSVDTVHGLHTPL